MVLKTHNESLLVFRSALFSDCGDYRYLLEIVWDATKPTAAFIGLNPSTADELKDDNTIRKCRAFAESWGCGGMRMLNLFAYRATEPKVMKSFATPIGNENDIAALIQGCTGPLVACWGTHGLHLDRGSEVKKQFRGLQCFGRNRDSTPRHPLYLSAKTRLEPFGRSKEDING